MHVAKRTVVFNIFGKGNFEHEKSSFIRTGRGFVGGRCHTRFAIEFSRRK